MACANKNKNSSKTLGKKFRVLVFYCPDCGEEKHYVLVCDHCGATLEYKKTLHLSLDEIKVLVKELREEGTDLYGDLDKILEDEDDFDIGEAKVDTAADADSDFLPPLDDEELDNLDDFEPL